jgi:hypothetical protein
MNDHQSAVAYYMIYDHASIRPQYKYYFGSNSTGKTERLFLATDFPRTPIRRIRHLSSNITLVSRETGCY